MNFDNASYSTNALNKCPTLFIDEFHPTGLLGKLRDDFVIEAFIRLDFLKHPPFYRHHGKAGQGSVEKRRHGQQNSLLTCGQPAIYVSHMCWLESDGQNSLQFLLYLL